MRELAAEHARLSALSLPGDLSVRAAFDASYQALPAQAARAYRVVALIPGPDFPADLAAAALNDQERGHRLLDALADASLLAEAPDGSDEVPNGSRTEDSIGFSWKGTGSNGQKSEEVFS